LVFFGKSGMPSQDQPLILLPNFLRSCVSLEWEDIVIVLDHRNETYIITWININQSLSYKIADLRSLLQQGNFHRILGKYPTLLETQHRPIHCLRNLQFCSEISVYSFIVWHTRNLNFCHFWPSLISVSDIDIITLHYAWTDMIPYDPMHHFCSFCLKFKKDLGALQSLPPLMIDCFPIKN
jgi:hypothetical protein